MSAGQHVLVVEEDARYRIECPHPESHPSCATWEPCGCDAPRMPPKDGEDPEDAELAEEAWGSPCPRNPGLTHRYDPEYVGEMCAPTGSCWPAEMAGDIEPADIKWPEPGRYVIEWHCEDGCYLDITSLTPVPHASDSHASVSPEQTPSPAADSAHRGDQCTVPGATS